MYASMYVCMYVCVCVYGRTYVRFIFSELNFLVQGTTSLSHKIVENE
jgi:hypothetical protein